MNGQPSLLYGFTDIRSYISRFDVKTYDKELEEVTDRNNSFVRFVLTILTNLIHFHLPSFQIFT